MVSVRFTGALLTHFSVGPVGGAAVARFVNLALLLQSARLATMVGTTLDTGKTGVCKTRGEFSISDSADKTLQLLPVHPEPGGGAAAVSVVAGEERCERMGLVHTLQELHRGSEALDRPALMAGWREEGWRGNPAYQKTVDEGKKKVFVEHRITAGCDGGC